MPTSPSPNWERARSDLAFLRRVQSRYQGDRDVWDALWWLDHPDEIGPSGAAPPTLERRRLRTAVYAPSADGDAVARLEAFDAVEARERDAVLEAVRLASDHQIPLTLQRTTPRHERGARAHPRGPGYAAVAVLALLIGLGIGLSVRGVDGAASPTDSRSAPRATPQLSAVAVPLNPAYPTRLTGALRIFARPPVASDRPATPIGSEYQPLSFRRLPGGDASTQLFAAERDSDRQVCLVLVVSNGATFGACEAADDFADHPLQALAASPPMRSGTTAPPPTGGIATWSERGVSFVPSER